MSDCIFIRSGNGLVPSDEKAKKSLSQFGQGELVPCKIASSTKRSLEQLHLYWSGCQLVSNNSDDTNLDNKDKVSEQCKIALRFVDYWYYYTNAKTGEKQLNIRTKSISFSNLDSVEANNFFDKAFEWLAKCLDISKDEFILEIKNSKSVLKLQAAFNGKIV